MNWYKKAKLADKIESPTHNMYSACMFCKRWATYDGSEEAPPQDKYIWKKKEELDSNEQAHAYAAEFERTNPGKRDFAIDVSHGICAYCSALMEELGYPQGQEERNELIEMSLSM
jgi:hypothetical protein